MMTIENAVARSISHDEIAYCDFRGDIGQLENYIGDAFDNGDDAIFSVENDGTIDVADCDNCWRIRVTLIEVVTIGEWGMGSGDAGHIVCDANNREAVQSAYDAIEEGDLSSDVLAGVYAAGGEYVAVVVAEPAQVTKWPDFRLYYGGLIVD